MPKEQIEVQLGHRVIDSVTDLYAVFDPDYQREATQALEAIIEEIERSCPGAFGGSNAPVADAAESKNVASTENDGSV